MLREYSRIIKDIDWDQPWYSFFFISLLVALGCVTALTADWTALGSRWSSIWLFAALSALAEILYVQLPLGRGRVSVGFAINLGAVLLFAPHEAALIAAAGVFTANLLQGLSLDITFFNAGQMWTTTLITALFWRAIGPGAGFVPVLGTDLPALLLGLLVVVLIYFTCNALLVTAGISFAHGLPLRDILNKNTLWIIPNHLALGSLGFLIAILYLNVGLYGVLLLWIPLLLARYSFQQYMNIRAAHLETIRALASALDAKDPYTRGHSDRVSQYAVDIGRHLKLSDGDVEMLQHAGILHDIGKIGISDTVLNKVGRLTDEEFELVKSHAVIGAQMVRPVGFLSGISEVIRHHHERYDGLGYPDGIAGEEIPLGARIMSVADAFDAMTFERVYRAGMAPDLAVEQLQQGRGSQFDPAVVDVFIENVLPKYIDELPRPLVEEDGSEVQGDRLWRYMVEQEGEGSHDQGMAEAAPTSEIGKVAPTVGAEGIAETDGLAETDGAAPTDGTAETGAAKNSGVGKCNVRSTGVGELSTDVD